MYPILFEIGTIKIYAWGTLVALAFVVALFLTYRDAKRTEIEPSKVLDFGFWLLIAGLIGARIVYLLFEIPTFLKNPIQSLFLQQGGLSIHGAVIGGVIAGVIFARRQKISFASLADLVAPPLVLAQAIGRWGCFLGAQCYGKIANVPWAVKFVGIDGLRHPTQLYESVFDIIIFAFLWKWRTKKRFKGEIFLLYLILYSIGRSIVETFRDNPAVFGSITAAQLASLPIAVIALILLIRKRAQSTKTTP